MTKEINREEWLSSVMDELRPMFKQHGFVLPKNVRVTCGFPSTHARSALKRAIGESWTSDASGDGTFEVLISPVEEDSVKAGAILAHELAHVAAGHQHGHRGPFVACIRAIGLEGKPSATVAGEDFAKFMKGVIKLYGKYPHAMLDVNPNRKIQGTRLLKCYCSNCGYTVRVTAKWIDRSGAPICPGRNCNELKMSVARVKAKE